MAVEAHKGGGEEEDRQDSVRMEMETQRPLVRGQAGYDSGVLDSLGSSAGSLVDPWESWEKPSTSDTGCGNGL
jgi:hypothetical protein